MKVKFVPQNVEFEIKPGQSVMHLAEDNGLYIKSVCRGVPSCAECRIKIVDGESNVFPPAASELQLIGTGWFIDRRRLSCQLQCIGDVTVDLTEQVAKQQGPVGGRKSKKKQIVGDRVEDESVIREKGAETSESTESEEERPEIRPEIRPAGPVAGGDTPRAVIQPRTNQGNEKPRSRGPKPGGDNRRPR